MNSCCVISLKVLEQKAADILCYSPLSVRIHKVCIRSTPLLQTKYSFSQCVTHQAGKMVISRFAVLLQSELCGANIGMIGATY